MRLGQLAIRKNVLSNSKVVTKTQLLQHSTDSKGPRGLWRPRANFDSIKHYECFLLLMNARGELHQRGFPRTIFSDEGADLPRIEAE